MPSAPQFTGIMWGKLDADANIEHSALSLKWRPEKPHAALRWASTFGCSRSSPVARRPSNLYTVGKSSASSFKRYLGLWVGEHLVTNDEPQKFSLTQLEGPHAALRHLRDSRFVRVKFDVRYVPS